MAKPSWSKRAKAWVDWRGKPFRKLRSQANRFGKTGFERYGKLFLTTFPKTMVGKRKERKFDVDVQHSKGESLVSIAIQIERIGNTSQRLLQNMKTDGLKSYIAEVKIKFEKNAAVIETFQGLGKKGADITIFGEVVGKPWDTYLTEMAEKHGRKCGFKQAKIRDPRTLYSYQNPIVSSLKEKNDVRQRMLKRIERIAKERNYRKEGGFFVKDL